MDRLDSEMSSSGTGARERQSDVRKLNLGSSGDADLQRRWTLSLKGSGLPLPMILVVPVSTKRTMVVGLSTGQELVS